MLDQYQLRYIMRVPLFSRLHAHHTQLLAQAFEVRNYRAGEFIFQQGAAASGLVILMSGMAGWWQTAPDGQARQVGAMQEGDFAYPEALFTQVNAQAFLRAEYPCMVLLLTAQRFAVLVNAYPELKVALGIEQAQAPQQAQQAASPAKKRFDSQRDNEKVLLETRRHSWAYMRHLWMPTTVMISIWILSGFTPNIAIWLIPFSFLIFAVFAAYFYAEWANDVVIITTQRVIQITRTILTFHKEQREVAVESIQEANAEIASFDIFARIFRYGYVELKTAGAEGNFTLAFLPDPEKVQKLILEDLHNHKQSIRSREQQALLDDIERWTSGASGTGQQATATSTGAPKNAAREAKLKNIYNEGEGPLSPFVTSFPSDGGGIVYRKHWIVWLSAVFIPALCLIGVFFGTIILLALGVMQTIGITGWLGAFAIFLVSAGWFWYSDWDWRHDYYLVADNSITIVYQRPLFMQNEIERILLKQVDSVTAETRGIRQRIFGYGDVRVSLVGADDHKLFDDVANPEGIQNEISARQQRIKEQGLNQQDRQQREAIGEYIAAYHQHQQQKQANLGTQSVEKVNPLQPSPLGVRPPRPAMSRGRPYHPGQNYNPQAAQQPYVPNAQQQGYTPQGQQPYVPNPQQQGYTSQGQQPYVPNPQQQGYTPQGQQPYVPNSQQQGYAPQGQQPYVPNPQQQGYTPQGQAPVQGNYAPPPPARKKPPKNNTSANPPSRFPHNKKKP